MNNREENETRVPLLENLAVRRRRNPVGRRFFVRDLSPEANEPHSRHQSHNHNGGSETQTSVAENQEEHLTVVAETGMATLEKEIESDKTMVAELKKTAQRRVTIMKSLKRRLEKEEADLKTTVEEIQFAEQEVSRKQQLKDDLEDDVEQEKLEHLERMLEAQKKRMADKKRKATTDNTSVEVLPALDSSVSIASVNVTCPITLQPMTDPVRNKVCGHVYSKAAIEEYLDTHNPMACPIVGCHNNHIEKSQLQDDTATKVVIDRARRRQASKKARTENEALDVDEQE